jgi:hypothetical protein
MFSTVLQGSSRLEVERGDPMTTQTDYPANTLTASAVPSTVAHMDAKRTKESERERLRYERAESRCHVSRVP